MHLAFLEGMRRVLGEAQTLPVLFRFLLLLAFVWASVEMFNGPTAQIIAQGEVAETQALPPAFNVELERDIERARLRWEADPECPDCARQYAALVAQRAQR